MVNTKAISFYFRLLDAGLQKRNIIPYLYFIDNNKNQSVKVLFNNNKWPFAKGMTLLMWINALRKVDYIIIKLNIDYNLEQLNIRGMYESMQIQQYLEKKQNSKIYVCSFPFNTVAFIGIQLQPINEGLFKGSSYSLNLNINGVQYNKIVLKNVKFQSSQFITEYSLLHGFVGNLYSVLISTKPQLTQFSKISKISTYGICSEDKFQQLINQKIIKIQNIICIYNPERFFQGLLLNYVNDKNMACFQGKVSQVKYHKYDDKIIDIFLPFLYMMHIVKQKDQQWSKLYDLILKHIIQIIGENNYQIQNVLLLLYFLEIDNYTISQSTLNCIYEHAKVHQNFYLNIVLKFMDVHSILAKNLIIDQQIQSYNSPVQKIHLLFCLQTKWNQKWNSLQGFQGWWSPYFFKPQIDQPYNANLYLFDSKKQSKIQWSVMNLITKDFCKCFIQPVFSTPRNIQNDIYQLQYIKKQCFNQQFQINLNKKNKYKVLICKKISNSKFDNFKNKILGQQQAISTTSIKKNTIKQLKQFSSSCLYIQILTIVDGVVKISKQGFITFTAKHIGKSFDHMCVKAFKNQMFYYITVHIQDIQKVYKKRFNSMNNAVYIKIKDGRQIMYHFYNKNADNFLSIIQPYVTISKDAFSNYFNGNQPFQWIDKNISNYQYLQWLNQIAGRNYSDITQYPVLPWTYISNNDKIEQQKGFRQLTKNMGLQGNQQRIRHFLQKYNSDNEEQLFNQYHFGTHYSSSAIIFNFLIRIRPYSIGAITLQSGKFDCADRIFYSYSGSWNNAISSPTDLRQLIPEIYTLPEMFINKNNYYYGTTQDKLAVDNVILPQWSKQNPYYFVAQLRKKLQSRYVSQNIHHWIDLIYGYKQRGKDALQSMNIFYPLTYQNCIDIQKVTDPEQRQSFQTQIAHFGQNPSQIIGNNPHPKRKTIKSKWEYKLLSDGGDFIIQKCFLSKASLKQQKYLYKSVFQGRNSILGIKFIDQFNFFVLRKHQYNVFRILNQKQNFLSKQIQISYNIEYGPIMLNYKQMSSFIPIVSIQSEIIIIGGFYNGNVQIIYLKQQKYNRAFKFPSNTITSLSYCSKYKTIYIVDTSGYLLAYKITISSKQIQFQQLKIVKAHDSKINDISINQKANLLCTSSEDGCVNIYNLYTINIIRVFTHPTGLPVSFAHITTNPLYALVFYSKQNSTIFVYSINGQYLDSFCQKTGFIYNMAILKTTDSTQSIIYLNAQRQMFVWDLPFLKLKRKLKVKKDEFKISCFEACWNSKIAISGNEGGALQIIANTESF